MGKRAPKLLLIAGLICGIAALSLPVAGAETPMGGNLVERTEKLKKRLEARIAEVTRNPAQRRAIIDEGRERTVLCSHCHGKDGIAIQRPGLKRIVPNLAGQNPVYIIDQFQRFEDNRRQDFMMGGLAKNFSEEDMIKMAIYYSRMRSKTAGGGRPDLRAKGKQIFSQICVGCHGEDGKGQEGYAMIAGQRADYVVQMLKTFRDDRERRVNPWMTGVALGLSDEDMEAVASYLANLK
jgi:cytochrome c553